MYADGTFFASRLETSNAPEKSIRHYQPLPFMRLDTKSPRTFQTAFTSVKAFLHPEFYIFNLIKKFRQLNN
jgi:hypothetical protein